MSGRRGCGGAWVVEVSLDHSICDHANKKHALVNAAMKPCTFVMKRGMPLTFAADPRHLLLKVGEDPGSVSDDEPPQPVIIVHLHDKVTTPLSSLYVKTNHNPLVRRSAYFRLSRVMGSREV